ncbi:MAG: ribose ABC transporter permease [Synergistaceae bacterium]|jgi:ribose transport system permease protein|nr:ribose ABC transporter permease [Synergistaceae bacterium]
MHDNKGNIFITINNNVKKTGIQIGALLGLLLLVATLSISTDKFLTLGNITNVVRQISINAIIAFGMTFVILIGGIDLSVGSIAAVAGLLAIYTSNLGWNPIIVIILSILSGVVLGGINGIIITKGRIAAIVATLATMTIFRGVCYVLTEGRPIRLVDTNFAKIGNGYLLSVPIPVIILAFVFVFAAVLLGKTKFGRHIYILGGNMETARLSGINIDLVTLMIFVISGAFSALSGLIAAARLYSAQPTTGEDFAMDAIAATILGGTSIAGGVGTIAGTIVGALIIGILNNGMNLLGIVSYYQMIVKGGMILLAILLDVNRGKANA